MLRSKVDLLYRILCFLAFLLVLVFIDSDITVLIITIAFFILTIKDKCIESIILYIITAVIFIICLVWRQYTLLRMCATLDYIYYFFSVSNYREEIIDAEKNVREKSIRFKKIKKVKKKESNNMLCTIFVTIHMMILLLAIMVG